MVKIRFGIWKKAAVVMLGVLSSVWLAASQTQATAVTACMIKIPTDAQLFIKGSLIDERQLITTSVQTGRIHEIAAAQTQTTCGYKQYAVYNLASPEDVKVYRSDMTILAPTDAGVNYIDYTGMDVALLQAMSGRIQEAAIAYTNRTMGRTGNANLSQYFLSGSDAYNKAVSSDEGRRWGQYVRPGGVQSVEVSEIYSYTEQAFTAKATVTSTPANGYVEIFDLYMLFQYNGSNYYVTYFTFMP